MLFIFTNDKNFNRKTKNILLAANTMRRSCATTLSPARVKQRFLFWIFLHKMFNFLLYSSTEVIVIDDGRAAERGTHEELLARGGIYNRLVQRQLADD